MYEDQARAPRVDIDGDALRTLRVLRLRGTSDLARSVGLTPAAICHLERGRRASVSGAVYAALVRELGIADRPDWIRPENSSASRLPSGIASGILSSTGTQPDASAA